MLLAASTIVHTTDTYFLPFKITEVISLSSSSFVVALLLDSVWTAVALHNIQKSHLRY